MATSTAEWIDELKSITVLELAERIKALEEEFGVSAQAAVAAAPAAGGGDGGGDAAEEQSAFDVVLTAAGDPEPAQPDQAEGADDASAEPTS